MPASRWRLSPVVPLVLYTGKRRWKDKIGLDALLPEIALLAEFIPSHTILFLDLQGTAPATLMEAGTAVALALRALQSRDAPKEALADALREIGRALDLLPESALPTVRRALYFLYLLIQHTREATEQNDLADVVVESVEQLRKEATTMGKTGAQVLMEAGEKKGREEGRQEGQRELLLSQMEIKFGPLTDATRQTVAGWEVARLQEAGRRILSASSLADLGIENAG